MKISFLDKLYRLLMTVNPMLTALVLVIIIFAGNYVADHYPWTSIMTHS